MEKRGQITLFIILGIFVLLIVLLIYYDITKEEIAIPSDIDIASVGGYRAKIVDQNGFIKRDIKHNEGKGNRSGRPSRKWIDVHRTKNDNIMIINHIVKEESPDGQWELVHRDIKKKPAKRRPNKGGVKK